MSHLGEVERWIKSTLLANSVVADGANGIHNTIAIQKNPKPFIVSSPQSQPVTARTLCGKVESIRAVYEIRAVGKDCGYARLEPLEDAIEAAIPVGRVQASGKRPRFAVTLLSPLRRMPPSEDGAIYEAGGIYSFFVTPG